MWPILLLFPLLISQQSFSHGGICLEDEWDAYLVCHDSVSRAYSASFSSYNASTSSHSLNQTTLFELGQAFFCNSLVNTMVSEHACIQTCLPNSQFDNGRISARRFCGNVDNATGGVEAQLVLFDCNATAVCVRFNAAGTSQAEGFDTAKVLVAAVLAVVVVMQ